MNLGNKLCLKEKKMDFAFPEFQQHGHHLDNSTVHLESSQRHRTGFRRPLDQVRADGLRDDQPLQQPQQ